MGGFDLRPWPCRRMLYLELFAVGDADLAALLEEASDYGGRGLRAVAFVKVRGVVGEVEAARPRQAQAEDALEGPLEGEGLVHHEQNGIVHGRVHLPNLHDVAGQHCLYLAAAKGEDQRGRPAVQQCGHLEGGGEVRPPEAFVLLPAAAGVPARAAGHDDVVAPRVRNDVELLARRAHLDLDSEVSAVVLQGRARGRDHARFCDQGRVRGGCSMALLHEGQGQPADVVHHEDPLRDLGINAEWTRGPREDQGGEGHQGQDGAAERHDGSS
mmetsp:Transcript_49124/g.131490  ORF Transcript_49124/g.131490 Transcript_49124/m.131490 type:complete len:270 (-) Transcript_49124:128-937(-)